MKKKTPPRGGEMIRRAITLAKKTAEKSSMSIRHGAVLMSNGKICSTGYNHSNSIGNRSLDIPDYLSSTHAEIDCLANYFRNCRKRNRKYILFVIRILKDGNFACSKPCSLCIDFLKKIGIRKVYYISEKGVLECPKISFLKSSFITSGTRRLLKK